MDIFVLGSALLLCSASHLANMGTAVYLEELVMVQKRVLRRAVIALQQSGLSLKSMPS